MITRDEVLDAIREINETNAPEERSKFVGAVLDIAEPAVGDQDVAVVIGINYGQSGTSKDDLGQAAVSIGYGSKVRRIWQHASGRSVQDFHVVLWNFYPHLTEKEWLQDVKNSRDEAKRIFEDGYADPIREGTLLLDRLAPKLIVFHGITSCVPVLARILMRGRNEFAVTAPNLARNLDLNKVRPILSFPKAA